MMDGSALGLGEPRTAQAPEDWVLPISLDEPGRVLPSNVPLAEWGPLRGFFHGLLYDREELENLTGCRKQGCSDAELVLRAYERQGEALLPKLRGSFIVAIIDTARNRAIIARDPLGSHPLFYAEVGSRVVFAESPKPLLAYKGVSRALNRAALADHLCHRWPDPHETFYASVRRLPPTWHAVLSGGGLRLERYWLPALGDNRIEWLTAEEAGKFDEVFDRAVDRCMRNGPSGIFLSGGLDSISIAAVAADHARRTDRALPLALSLGFPDPACDERVIQAAVARDLGLRQHLLGFHEALGSRPLFEQALELNQFISAPLLNIYHPAYLELARLARRDGVRAIFTGQGGDEWLTVTPYLAADLIRRGSFGEFARFFNTLRRSNRSSSLALARNLIWRFGLRPLGGLLAHRMMPRAHDASRMKRLFAEDPIWLAPDRELRLEQLRRGQGALAPSDPPQGFYARELLTGLDHTLTSWELEEQHEVTKPIGVHFVRPYCDPDLVEMLCRTPPHILNDGGRSKGLVRGTLARRFPNLGFERQRKVFATSFFATMLRRQGPVLADAAGDFPSLSALGIVDGRKTSAFVHKALGDSHLRIRRVWEPLNLEMWVQSHGG